MKLTLAQAIAFCCGKDEVVRGWGERYCPFSTEAEAAGAFDAWLGEAMKWKGPAQVETIGTARRIEWDDLRLKHQGRGIGVWIRRGSIDEWWHERATWQGDPCGGVHSWD